MDDWYTQESITGGTMVKRALSEGCGKRKRASTLMCHRINGRLNIHSISQHQHKRLSRKFFLPDSLTHGHLSCLSSFYVDKQQSGFFNPNTDHDIWGLVDQSIPDIHQN